MKIQQFEDVYAWQKAQEMAVEIYSLFKSTRDFGFRDQICKAVVSISNNIAEGFDRSSDRDFRRFLFYSIASCSEVKSMIYLAEKLKYLSTEETEKLLIKISEVSKIIRGFINVLKK
jgi:four helix bundle protein